LHAALAHAGAARRIGAPTFPTCARILHGALERALILGARGAAFVDRGGGNGNGSGNAGPAELALAEYGITCRAPALAPDKRRSVKIAVHSGGGAARFDAKQSIRPLPPVAVASKRGGGATPSGSGRDHALHPRRPNMSIEEVSRRGR
jgi:hypothetical protein